MFQGSDRETVDKFVIRKYNQLKKGGNSYIKNQKVYMKGNKMNKF